jgi:hypothetical protein
MILNVAWVTFVIPREARRSTNAAGELMRIAVARVMFRVWSFWRLTCCESEGKEPVTGYGGPTETDPRIETFDWAMREVYTTGGREV